MDPIADRIRAMIAAVESYGDLSTERDLLLEALAHEDIDPTRLGHVIRAASYTDTAKLRLEELLAFVLQGHLPFVQKKLHALALLRSCLDAVVVKSSPNDPRDRFCYESLAKGKKLLWIKAKVREKEKWGLLHTVEAVSAAARRYAKRKGKPWPIQR